eukprot:TRINITY_DN40355_c0_g1_i1.p1 TRINITY_DN40355_c0_g1~~TRINITY_DN40355_c0_g1_i1.p1  ORF type:complete len:454 (-),score=65.65 TRINITY_DN40355_c0_g1_i1:171-1532(-)
MLSDENPCSECGSLGAPLRCGRCKSALYCSADCQRKHWPKHKGPCKQGAAMLATSLLASSLVSAVASEQRPFVEAASVPTRGAAGWAHFAMDDEHYLAVANFFTSSPGRQPRMETDSAVYKVRRKGGTSLQLEEVQRMKTVGAHGVEHFAHKDRHYLAIPNYYGEDTAIYRWSGSKFEELQRIKTDGAGSVDVFRIGDQQMLGIAEFNVGVAAIHRLEGEYPKERFVPWQRVAAPGVGAMATLLVDSKGGDKKLLLIAASYVTRQTGWRTRSPVFALNAAGTAFEPHHDVGTIGAHDVEVTSVGSRHFVFFSNDKDERSTLQKSELFEWVGTFPEGRLESRQHISTDGAHAAEFFSSPDEQHHYLAVANLGDRKTDKYRRDSAVYELQPSAKEPLKLVQKLPTLGATDFLGFTVDGATFLAVSNEQDDERGGDINSPIWVLQLPTVGSKGSEL